jgi:hypothetical protein
MLQKEIIVRMSCSFLIFYPSSSYLLCRFTLNAKVLALGEGGDFGAQNCEYTTKVDVR